MNLLEKLCKELGVELGEEWKNKAGDTYKITKEGLFYKFSSGDWEEGSNIEYKVLLKGELKPIWKPKDGEMYYTPRFTHDPNHRYCADVWRNGKWDNWAYDNKLIFKTKQEAINCVNEMIILAKHGI